MSNIKKNERSSVARALVEQYARRTGFDRYAYFNPDVYMNNQERERAIIQMFASNGLVNLSKLTLIDIGCGHGKNFLSFLKYGFKPENMVGLEFFEDRCEYARSILPSTINLISGDALESGIASESIDVISQFVVFSSILDGDFQVELAKKMWSWLKPGGCVLWYDFVYNNPSNSDVRGVSKKRIKELFPNGDFSFKRVTLAPPLSRRISKLSPVLYTVFNAFPFLRTHQLVFIKKSA
jgi:SAM-dependent methyltransferase